MADYPRKAEAKEPGWSHHKLTAEDAIEGGVLDRDTVEQARRDLPDAPPRNIPDMPVSARLARNADRSPEHARDF